MAENFEFINLSELRSIFTFIVVALMSKAPNKAGQPDEKVIAQLQALAYYLRNVADVKSHMGIFNEQRAMYFRGKHAYKALFTDKYKKYTKKPVPEISNDDEAKRWLTMLQRSNVFLQVDREASNTGSTKILRVATQADPFMNGEKHFMWVMPPDSTKQKWIAYGVVLLVLALVMFPLWPRQLRLGVYYLSWGFLGLVGLFIAVAIFRLIFFGVTYFAASPGIWIFPNLFEDVGFVDSFIPLWGWNVEPVKASKKKTKKSKTVAPTATTTATEKAPVDRRPKIEEIDDDEE